MNYDQHYAALFEQLEEEYGKLDPETIMGIIGFSGGGPVSLCERKSVGLFVTCELSVYEEQKPSTDDIKFEFFSKDDFDEKGARSIFTALGALSMEAQLGNNHTVDVCIAEAGISKVTLKLFSTSTIEGRKYGLYRVLPYRS